jgi:Raf kinase inhibitor-like YbhB/YbcL family protein
MMLKTIAVLLLGTLVVEAQMKLTSPSFENQQPIPAKHTGEGADASPALKWEGAPSSTKSFALICDDPDAPVGTWVHWVIYNIPASTTTLPEGFAKSDTTAGARQGVNDFGKVGYNGPMPPRGHGKHRYFFKVFALKSELDLKPRATKAQVEAAMQGQILAQAELVGTYERR